MPAIVSRVVDVYPYRHRRTTEFLLLRRSAGTIFSGEWRMVGGKIEEGETAVDAAKRELQEETGVTRPRLGWTVPTVNTFYEWETDQINLTPAFAVELDERLTLNREHDAFAWLPIGDAVNRLQWSEQQRLIRTIYEVLSRGTIPRELLVPWE